MIWSPLGGGSLFTDTKNERVIRIRTVADELCEEYQCELDQLLLAWLMKHPAGLVPVLGTTKIARIKRALDAIKLNLTHQDWYKLWEASKGAEVA